MRTPAPRSLAARFVLIVVGGVLLPLALVGWWLAHATERAGTALLRDQLANAADVMQERLATRWSLRHGELLLLANNTSARALLSSPGGPAMDAADQEYLHQLTASLTDVISSVSYLDLAGAERWSAAPADAGPTMPGRIEAPLGPIPASQTLRVELPVRSEAGETLGTVVARVRLTSLFALDAAQTVVPGARLSVRAVDGLQWSNAPADLDFFATVPPEGWEAAVRTPSGVPLRFAVAAESKPYVAPFRRASRLGLGVLVAVALVTLVLAVVLTRRVTRSLAALADAVGAVAGGDLHRTVDVPRDDEIGRVASAFNVMTDSLRRTLCELSQQRALAAVGEFASSLAHDVRNSLTAIRVDLQHAERHLPEDNNGTALVVRALDSVRRLDSTVTGALRLARSGQSSPATLELHEVLRAAMRGAEESFAHRGALLEPLAGGPPLELTGDAPALEQLFLNLLFNAAEALPTGSHAHVEVESQGGTAVVKVIDSGVGIPAEALAQVGTPFRSTKTGGTGLGLPIARRIAAAHGGDLQVESKLGEGTTVTVRLPLA